MMTCHKVFNTWPKTTLLPVWPRDAKRWAPQFQRKSAQKPEGCSSWAIRRHQHLAEKSVAPVEAGSFRA